MAAEVSAIVGAEHYPMQVGQNGVAAREWALIWLAEPTRNPVMRQDIALAKEELLMSAWRHSISSTMKRALFSCRQKFRAQMCIQRTKWRATSYRTSGGTSD